MDILLLISAILLLYLRTKNYEYLMDDEVKFSQYLRVFTTDLGHTPAVWYERKRTWGTWVTSVGSFALCVWAIYTMWGFWAALLFTVFPLNVSGVAWVTGGYYMRTVWLTLVVHYFCAHFGLIGTAIGGVFFATALNATISSIPYAFISPIITQNLWNLVLIIPLLFFIFGKKFIPYLKKRKEIHDNIGIKSAQIDPMRIFVVFKVLAYYIVLSLFPSRLGFFHSCPYAIGESKPDRPFKLALPLVLLFGYLAWTIDWRMCVWWFFAIGLYSQYTTFGMFVAERYTYLANVAFCVLLAKFLPEWMLIGVACFWFSRSWDYIKTFKNNLLHFVSGSDAFPESPENFNNVGSWYLDKKHYMKAAEYLLISEKLQTTPSYQLYANLASCLIHLGSYSNSRYYALRALQYAPKDKYKFIESQILWLDNKLVDEAKEKKLRKRGQ